jgi:transcriptional regulator with XRE-family HTH domain
MTKRLDVAELLRTARTAAGLTQRALALRANTSQSVVARVESGQTSPSARTLERLLNATGHELRTELAVTPVIDSHMMDDVDRILRLSPEERLREAGNVSHFLQAARRV